jgi:sugar lactone lactonase YvrE
VLRSIKSKFFFYFSLLCAILLTGGIADGVSTWVNNENAVTVLGQPNFLSATAASGPSAMFQPSAVRFDPISGKVFVADCANNRVLRFANSQALANGGAAEAAFGQIDLNAASGGFSQSKIRCAGEMAIDAAGRLWIADIDNSRVLRWDSAATIPSGQPANGVLGQPDFATVTAGTTSSKMNLPEGLFVDAAGRLWVADTGNNRVLRFDSAAAKLDGAGADAVLGQLDLVSSAAAMTQINLAAPNSITGNSTGSIWVSDSGNDRVLRFDVAALKANGAGADGILGSTSYTTLTSTGTTRTSMDSPTGLTIDPLGRLYVADGANDRVLIFNFASFIVDGAGASNVLGQPGFTDATARLSQSGFDMPQTPTWDDASQSLWTADLANNRVLRFTPQVATSGNVGLSGRVLDGSGRGLRNAHVSFTDSTGEMRTTVTNSFGYYSFDNVASGSTVIMNVSARGYIFPSRVVQAFDSLTDVNFRPQ